MVRDCVSLVAPVGFLQQWPHSYLRGSRLWDLSMVGCFLEGPPKLRMLKSASWGSHALLCAHVSREAGTIR